MRTRLVLATLVFLAGLGLAAADNTPVRLTGADLLKEKLPGTWDCALPANWQGETKHIKLVTTRHYTWVTYDSKSHEIFSTSGGTWTVNDGKYEESCDFASDTHQHLRGKTFDFDVELNSDRWAIKIRPGGEIDVDEVWNRILPAADQKVNAEPRGRSILGTWEGTVPPRIPKAARVVKHVTPTHWTWVIYDRDNRRVLGAIGGTWALKGNQYEETVDFATDNVPGVLGKSFAYDFKVEGDQWLIKRGPRFDDRTAEVWKRVK